MNHISANDLKKKGISALAGMSEAIITVRGESRYVVLDFSHYEHLREIELEMAVLQAKQDVENGKFITNVAKHIKKISKEKSKK